MSASAPRKGSALVASGASALVPTDYTSLFGFPEDSPVTTYVSPKFGGKGTLSPRGNFVFFAAALTVGVAASAFPYGNPNRVGRGGCSPYCSERFGPLEMSGGFVRIADPAYREELKAVVVSLLGGEEGFRSVLSRIGRDTTECSPNRKPGRVGTLP